MQAKAKQSSSSATRKPDELTATLSQLPVALVEAGRQLAATGTLPRLAVASPPPLPSVSAAARSAKRPKGLPPPPPLPPPVAVVAPPPMRRKLHRYHSSESVSSSSDDEKEEEEEEEKKERDAGRTPGPPPPWAPSLTPDSSTAAVIDSMARAQSSPPLAPAVATPAPSAFSLVQQWLSERFRVALSRATPLLRAHLIDEVATAASPNVRKRLPLPTEDGGDGDARYFRATEAYAQSLFFLARTHVQATLDRSVLKKVNDIRSSASAKPLGSTPDELHWATWPDAQGIEPCLSGATRIVALMTPPLSTGGGTRVPRAWATLDCLARMAVRFDFPLTLTTNIDHPWQVLRDLYADEVMLSGKGTYRIINLLVFSPFKEQKKTFTWVQVASHAGPVAAVVAPAESPSKEATRVRASPRKPGTPQKRRRVAADPLLTSATDAPLSSLTGSQPRLWRVPGHVVSAVQEAALGLVLPVYECTGAALGVSPLPRTHYVSMRGPLAALVDYALTKISLASFGPALLGDAGTAAICGPLKEALTFLHRMAAAASSSGEPGLSPERRAELRAILDKVAAPDAHPAKGPLLFLLAVASLALFAYDPADADAVAALPSGDVYRRACGAPLATTRVVEAAAHVKFWTSFSGIAGLLLPLQKPAILDAIRAFRHEERERLWPPLNESDQNAAAAAVQDTMNRFFAHMTGTLASDPRLALSPAEYWLALATVVQHLYHDV